MNDVPADLYRADQVRRLDRTLIERHAIPGIVLMQRAGAAAFALLRARWPRARRVAVFCGPGNNGGDGYVVARLARQAGLDAVIVRPAVLRAPQGDAGTAFEDARAAGVSVRTLADLDPAEIDVAVDALLGIGLSGEVTGVMREAIAKLLSLSVPVLAVDIPSGLHADSGRVLGIAAPAQATITFIGVKQGLVTGDGPAYCGSLHFDDLGAPAELYALEAAAARRLDAHLPATVLAPRARTAHKGDFGHVLVLGGDFGMPGAVRLSASAAAHSGAGLTSVATRPEHTPVVVGGQPELMCHGVVTPARELPPLLARASVVAVGPGLGRRVWGRGVFAAALEAGKPLVVDADGLNLLADDPVARGNWVLTPHPGEAARLLGCTVADVQVDRFAAVQSLAERYDACVVLKGAGSLIAGGDAPVGVCTAGNPGMASGGMGDLLTGIVAALIAQGLSLPLAARVGVCVHAAAADRAAAVHGERGLLASDLLPHVRHLLNHEAP